MIPLNYHHLYYFWLTVKLGRIGAASRELHLSQPALSLQIRQLERAFGKRLLERSRAGVTPTDDGRIAFAYCERIFSQGEELAAAMSGRSSSPVLRLGLGSAVSRHAISQVLRRLQEGAKVRVRIEGGAAEDLAERLARHRLDLVVAAVDLQLGVEFRSRLAGEIPLALVAHPRVAAGLGRPPKGLQGVSFLLKAPNNPGRKEVDLYLSRHGVSVEVDAEVDDSELLRQLALAGRGVAALDELTVQEDLRRGRLKRLPVREGLLREQVWFAAGRHPKPNPILREALEGLMGDFVLR